MVRIDKIYTRTGDRGKTSLVDGQRVSKHAKRPAAFGEVDEANCIIGLARQHSKDASDDMLARIQNDLFDLGADLATPIKASEPEGEYLALRITEAQVLRLEAEIDGMNANISALTSFILPGGSALSAWLHLARTAVRRTERRMTALAEEESVNKQAMRYINRLSDHLFVMARVANENGASDVLWVPGEHRQ